MNNDEIKIVQPALQQANVSGSVSVVHCKKEKYDVYIGRVSNAKVHYGNPFTHKKDTLASVVLGSREECIDAFRKWVLQQDYRHVEPERRNWIRDNLHTLKGKTLGCWCKPQSCHGDILAELLNNF